MKNRTAAYGAHAGAGGWPKEVVTVLENGTELPLQSHLDCYTQACCCCSAVQSICVYLSPSLGKQLKYLNKTTCLKLAQLNSGDLFWLAINFCVFSN